VGECLHSVVHPWAAIIAAATSPLAAYESPITTRATPPEGNLVMAIGVDSVKEIRKPNPAQRQPYRRQ
jgi:hypothetical protein